MQRIRRLAMDENLYPIDLLDVLLDKDNHDPIVLMDENGRQLSFEQVAMIVREVDGEKRLFPILKPIDRIKGIDDDAAIVFRVEENEEGVHVLLIEENEEIAVAVFDEYLELLKEEKEKRGKN